MQQTIEQIAKDCLDIQTLKTRNRDALDFHDLAVWKLKQALEAAYIAGRKNRKHSLTSSRL